MSTDIDNFNKIFAERLRSALDGRSQSEVARRLGFSRAMISKYLAGDIPESFLFLIKLSKEFMIDLHELLTGSTSPKTETKEQYENSKNTLKQVLEHYKSMIQSTEYRLKAEIESDEMELKSLEISWEAYKAGHLKFDQAEGPNQLHQRIKSNKFIIDTQQRELRRIEQLSATLDSDLKSITETFLE